jgi:hypothetical protein
MPRKVVLSLPKLGVTGGGIEKKKEIYVLSFVSDLAPPAKDSQGKAKQKLPEIVAAHNETLPNLLPEIASEALMQFVLVSASNTFARIKPTQPVSLSGSGILLYPYLDPNGLLASHFVVVESDANKRNLGKLLGDIFANKAVTGAVDGLIKAGITQANVAALLGALVAEVPAILKKNKDDLLFAHSHSGFDFDNYGCGPGASSADFELGNDRANCTLRVLVTD